MSTPVPSSPAAHNMSRAFVREPDGDDAVPPLPELPASDHPNYVTARGLLQLRERLTQAQQRLSAVGLTELERAWAQREFSWLQSRAGSALLVEKTPRDEVGFGATVEIASEGQTRTWRIVGDDEADTKRGLISWNAPLARALLGARVGDTVAWKKPSGDGEMMVLSIQYPP